MKIVCDACQAKYSIADDKVQGKAFKIRCKKCNHIIVVKTGGEGATAAPAAAEKAKAAAAASTADQGGWHVVIDGEQVGPLSEGEVKEHLRHGKIDSDTLVWREGFSDWTALSAVPEMAAILARITKHPGGSAASREPARPSSSMNVAAAPAESEPDPFAAPTVVSPAATDMFAAVASAPAQAVPAPVAPAPSSPFLFGGGAPAQQPEQIVVKNPGNGMGTLTGQRNENSVLFSLSNLEALAVPSQGSAGIRPPSSTSNTEGSGLIDIRSMAAMTLKDGSGGESRRSSDALPTFSTPQFSPVAPVLLPLSSSGPPKWVYPVLGLLAVGILVLGYGIYKVVTAPPVGTPIIIAPPPAPPPPPAPAAQPVAPAAAPVAAEPARPAVVEEKPAAPAEEKPSEKAKTDKGRSHRKSSESASSSKGSSDSKRTGEAPPAASAPAATASKGGTGKKGKQSLDDLLGEVGSSKKGGDDSAKSAAPAVKLISLTQSDIVNAMKGVQPRVQACANQYKVPGTAMATIGVAAGGKVNKATVTGKFAGTPTGACVEQAARAAKFPACQSMTFPWPFTLSPR
jgi:predicted Zn finger-like uncharacterized protein